MKATEAAALLTIAAAFDNRKPDADQAKAWAMALDRENFEDCRTVVVEHYRKSREWLMPVNVIDGVARLRAERLRAYGPIEAIPGADPDDSGAYAQAYRDLERAIADGRVTEPEPAGELTHHDVIAELGHIGQEIPRD